MFADKVSAIIHFTICWPHERKRLRSLGIGQNHEIKEVRNLACYIDAKTFIYRDPRGLHFHSSIVVVSNDVMRHSVSHVYFLFFFITLVSHGRSDFCGIVLLPEIIILT